MLLAGAVQALVQAAASLQDDCSGEECVFRLERLIVGLAVAVLWKAQEPEGPAQRVVADLQRCLGCAAQPSLCLLRVMLAVVDLPAVRMVRPC